MSALEEYAASRMAAVPAYSPGAASADPTGKLSSNEAPFGPSPTVRRALGGIADSLNRYDGGQRALDAVARSVGVDASRVILTNGSDELCFLIATVFLAARDGVVVVSQPGYAIDATVSRIARSEIRTVPLRDGEHDLEALAAASVGAHVLWIPVPHNPTGVGVDPAAFERMLAAVPADCLVVLDEAYRGFQDEDARIDSLALLERFDNLLVQRTMSKDHGLAGLRVGFGLGRPRIIAALNAARGPFTVNAAALAATEADLENDDWRRMTVDLVRRERTRFESFLREEGIEYLPSQANFVAVRVPWGDISAALDREGLRVRPGEDLGMPGWCRISMGLPAPMARLRLVLREYARERMQA